MAYIIQLYSYIISAVTCEEGKKILNLCLLPLVFLSPDTHASRRRSGN